MRTFLIAFAGSVFARFDTNEIGKIISVSEAGNVSDLRYKLGIKRWTDTIHCHNHDVFRKFGGVLIHLKVE